MKDDIRTSLVALLNQHKDNAGTDMSGAIRDCFTQLAHLCDKEGLDPDERFDAAMEVYEAELYCDC